MKTRTSLLLILLLILVTYLTQRFNFEQYAQASFKQKLEVALSILNEKKSGLSAIAQMSPFGIYRDGIEIKALNQAQLESVNGADGGGIRLNEKGQFEILVNEDLENHNLAHALAHESRHIADEKESESYLSSQPQFKEEIERITYLLYNGESKRAFFESPKTTSFVLLSLYCTELRAYSINEKLERDGLMSMNRLLKKVGLSSFIEKSYLNRYGIKFEKTLLQNAHHNCEKSPSFAQYQKQLSQILSIHSSDRNPSSLAHAKANQTSEEVILVGFNSKSLLQ